MCLVSLHAFVSLGAAKAQIGIAPGWAVRICEYLCFFWVDDGYDASYRV